MKNARKKRVAKINLIQVRYMINTKSQEGKSDWSVLGEDEIDSVGETKGKKLVELVTW